MGSPSLAHVAVVGAGIIGLACGAALARRGRSVLVIEKEDAPGRGTSSRNSEVIHAGLYYPPGSLKATSCVEGRERLYQRCREHGIGHQRTGKLVVASNATESETLERIALTGCANGAGALELFDGDEVTRREPRVRAVAGLWSPESGIVDSHGLLLSYQAELESNAGNVVLRTAVVALEQRVGGWRLETQTPDGERFALEVPWVVNAAGLQGDRLAEAAGLDVATLGYEIHLCKGDYFAVAPALGALTQRLIYPVPGHAGLGIHITRDLGGRYRLGPDTEYVQEPRYDVDPAKATAFAAAVRRYLPEIAPEHLSPDFAGLRPKLQGPGEEFRDFVVREESSHGAPGLINLLGIESPGLTAAAALAERVAELVY